MRWQGLGNAESCPCCVLLFFSFGREDEGLRVTNTPAVLTLV